MVPLILQGMVFFELRNTLTVQAHTVRVPYTVEILTIDRVDLKKMLKCFFPIFF
jgi:hypothetical protein